MKKLFLSIFLFPILAGFSQDLTKAGVHKLKALEVIQTSSYTYVKVQEDTSVNWVAIPKMEAVVGETYYSNGAMEMRNFSSKELQRTFPLIYFMDFLSKTPEGTIKVNAPTTGDMTKAKMPEHGTKSKLQREEVSVQLAPGGIRISELLRNRMNYVGKVVKIRGQVIKYNEHIMGKNWVHLQDGTSFNHEYDLVVTTSKKVNVGDIVIFKGIISLNKDFGSGYSYEILMEDATIVE